MESLDRRYLAFGILEFLDSEFKHPKTTADSKESLEVAMQCLETAFNVSLRDEEFRTQKPLVQIHKEYLDKEGRGSGQATPTATGRARSQLKTDFMTQANTMTVDVGEPYALPPECSPDRKVEADQYKSIGNDNMKNGTFLDALENYTKAITLDGRNAVYFCNRAAAYLKVNELDKALRDCQIAIQLAADYARAFGRMGVTYSTKGDHVRAFGCYKKALSLEPDNESYKNNLRVVQEILETEASSADVGGGAAGGAAGGAGLPPNVQNIFNNPSLINMATQMMQDPTMQNMMRSIISGFNSGGSDTNSVDSLLQMGQAIANQIRQSNPNLADEIGTRMNNMNPHEPSSSPQGDSYDL
jgi:small glutamine-rich tetratricopeptide repeat-containing protein alpha